MVTVGKPRNTARTVCGIMLAALAAIVIAGVVVCCTGCETAAPSKDAIKADVAWALRIAYDVGGKAAVSNRIEQLVAKGRLTREQGDALHAAAQLAYEKIVDDLDGGGAGCVLPDAGECGDGDCNEDANCGACDDCRISG